MNKGFTLIELIIVIVILGILSVVAAPRFIDISDDALISKNKSVATSLQQAASFVRTKWLIAGQPQQGNGSNNPFVELSNATRVTADRSSGFPIGTSELDTISGVNQTDCMRIFNSIVDTDLVAKTRNSSSDANLQDVDILVSDFNNNPDSCV